MRVVITYALLPANICHFVPEHTSKSMLSVVVSWMCRATCHPRIVTTLWVRHPAASRLASYTSIAFFCQTRRDHS
jgi:hypothetical protein